MRNQRKGKSERERKEGTRALVPRRKGGTLSNQREECKEQRNTWIKTRTLGKHNYQSKLESRREDLKRRASSGDLTTEELREVTKQDWFRRIYGKKGYYGRQGLGFEWWLTESELKKEAKKSKDSTTEPEDSDESEEESEEKEDNEEEEDEEPEEYDEEDLEQEDEVWGELQGPPEIRLDHLSLEVGNSKEEEKGIGRRKVEKEAEGETRATKTETTVGPETTVETQESSQSEASEGEETRRGDKNETQDKERPTEASVPRSKEEIRTSKRDESTTSPTVTATSSSHTTPTTATTITSTTTGVKSSE